MTMVRIAAAIWLLGPMSVPRSQDPKSSTTEVRPTLPPVKRVRLKLDQTPLNKAEAALGEATGFPIEYRPRHGPISSASRFPSDSPA